MAGAPVAVYEVPLLFESGLDGMFDATMLVAVPDDVQLARLMQRDGSDETAARARIASQMSLAEKTKRATVVVDNAGTEQDTARELRAAWSAIGCGDVAFAAA